MSGLTTPVPAWSGALTAPAEYADWSAAAENVAEQLTAFGFKTSFRGVNFQQHPIDINEGRFQLAIRGWGAGNPHPSFSYENDFSTHNAAATGVGASGAGSIELPGMSFDLNVSTDSVGDVDLWALTKEAGSGVDAAMQIAVLDKIAMAYNELLPQIPLWEKYGNNPVPQPLRQRMVCRRATRSTSIALTATPSSLSRF